MKLFKIITIFFIVSVFHHLSAQNYSLSNSVFGAGGEFCSDEEFRLDSTVGQAFVGTMSGFWLQYNSTPVSIEENEILHLTSNLLSQNYPNPFNPTTNIEFIIRKETEAILTIFNMKGQTLERAVFGKGHHIYVWNADNYSSGVYYYTLESENYSETKKMIMLK